MWRVDKKQGRWIMHYHDWIHDSDAAKRRVKSCFMILSCASILYYKDITKYDNWVKMRIRHHTCCTSPYLIYQCARPVTLAV